MARLTKADVVRLVDGYDADPIGALSTALRRALDADDGADWSELLGLAPFDDARRAALAALDQGALDGLLVELNEQRSVAPGNR